MSIPATNPRIDWGTAYANTIWLPRKFPQDWKSKQADEVKIIEGACYVQRVDYSSTYERFEVTAKTDIFIGDAASGLDYESWRGAGAEAFLAAWAVVYAWLRAGKPFRFWRTYSATATHGDRNRFDRCVWSHKYDGIEGPTKGKPYYNLELKFLTEGDDR